MYLASANVLPLAPKDPSHQTRPHPKHPFVIQSAAKNPRSCQRGEADRPQVDTSAQQHFVRYHEPTRTSTGGPPMLAAIIEDNRDAITALCRKHRVEALWVFGSATSGAWNP